jgi:hypothetical protein
MDELLHDAEFMARLRVVPPDVRAAYKAARPYPHAILDAFFPPKVLKRVLADFPAPKSVEWQRFNNDNEKKLAFRDAESLPTSVREFLYFLNARPMLRFLESLTGIEALIPDPSFSGGGCHQIQRGGKLGVHVDFNKLEPSNLDRRLNVLVYLNEDWREEYGGHFEMWDAAGEHCVSRILPVFNRCVVFSTTETSYHGHPSPLTCPDDRTRKSIATYLYTNGRPGASVSEHSTIFIGNQTGGFLKKAVKQVLPPILLSSARSVLRRLGGWKS